MTPKPRKTLVNFKRKRPVYNAVVNGECYKLGKIYARVYYHSFINKQAKQDVLQNIQEHRATASVSHANTLKEKVRLSLMDIKITSHARKLQIKAYESVVSMVKEYYMYFTKFQYIITLI